MHPSLRTIPLALVVGTLLAACGTTAPVAGRNPSADFLSHRIDEVLRRPEVRHALWGIVVEDESGQRLYEQNATKMMTTASNRKLFVSALAAECFPLDSTIRTEILLAGPVENGVLAGDLVIRGDGDPALAGRYEYSNPKLPQRIVQALRDRGVRSIRGGVVGDVSAFDAVQVPGSWKVGNLGYAYAAEVDALAWNENVVGLSSNSGPCIEWLTTDPGFVATTLDVRCEEGELDYRSDASNRITLSGARRRADSRRFTAAASVEEPGLFAAQALSAHLLAEGISVGAAPRQSRRRIEGELLHRHDSAPLAQLLATVLKNSQNLYAEMIFKRTAPDIPRSYGAALERERIFLQALGIGGEEFEFSDGSGLSPENRVTPEGTLRILRYLGEGSRGGIFGTLMAAPGDEGTLRRRLAGLETRLRAKTGTIAGVAALSGWVDGANGGRRYFVIVSNQHRDGDAAVAAIDEIVRVVADF